MRTFRVLCLICIICLNILPIHAQDVVSDLLGRINNLRTQNGLAPYNLNGALTSAAQNHAAWMVNTGQVSHVQDNGSAPRDRAMAAGYPSNWVSENIYMGTMAGVNDAWSFWLNSAVHYAGLTNANYTDIGIASAQGTSGQSFVLVFGNSGASLASANRSNNGGGGGNSVAAAPSFVVGTDASGNIMHQVQEGDTFGDILLIYGYTWENLPQILELNGMTDADIRSLDIGAIVLIPPLAGTYTPTTEPTLTESPSATPTMTETPTATATIPAEQSVAPAVFSVYSETPTLPTATQTIPPTATSSMIISTQPARTMVAIASTPAPMVTNPPVDVPSNLPPLWVIGVVLVQIAVLIYAGIEFFRRLR